jgi:large subunit ribosomal protein L23
MVDPYKIIIMPWITEKTLNGRRRADPNTGWRENNNRLEFIVRRTASKPEIKAAIEMLLEVRIAKVNTKITKIGKHASVRLAEGYDAEEAALKLGAF